jgi:hypothetical protein
VRDNLFWLWKKNCLQKVNKAAGTKEYIQVVAENVDLAA